jgi:Beta-galactosidase
MMRHSPLLIPLFLFATVSGESQTNALPQIRQNGAVKQLFVDNKPFIMLAGELHNSSASSVEYMKPIWDKLASMHLNTVIGTASWELVEPEEGKFDFSLVDAQIGEARRRNMRLVLIWFATWKNAGSSYVPHWVKADRKRFQPSVIKVRPNGGMASYLATYMSQQGTVPLSPLGNETLKADARAPRRVERLRRPTQVARDERDLGLGDDAPRAGHSLFRTEGARSTSHESLRSNEVAELRHRDASKRERRRVVAQGDPLQCAEGITR